MNATYLQNVDLEKTTAALNLVKQIMEKQQQLKDWAFPRNRMGDMTPNENVTDEQWDNLIATLNRMNDKIRQIKKEQEETMEMARRVEEYSLSVGAKYKALTEEKWWGEPLETQKWYNIK